MNILKYLLRKALITFYVSASFLILLVLADYPLKKILPIYDPSGGIKHVINDGVLLLEKNTSVRQWKNTGDYNVIINSNKYGFRNKKDFKKVKKDAFYVVGDSHTFGHGLEEEKRYSDLLETKYKIGEFVNIAISGMGVDGYHKALRYSKKNGAQIKRIFLGLTLENDINDYEKMFSKVKVLPEQKNYLSYFKELLRSKSSIYNLLTTAIHRNSELKKIAIKLKLIIPAHKVRQYADKKAIISTVNYINRIKSEFNPEQFYVLLLPSRGLWFVENTEEYFNEHNSIKRLLEQSNLTIIDPLSVFLKSDNPRKYHFKYDGHFNELGHSVIASVINDTLK